LPEMAPRPEGPSVDEATQLPPAPPVRNIRQHGVKGAYYGGDWLDIEDCAGSFNPSPEKCASCPHNANANTNTHSHAPCPRSKSRNDASRNGTGTGTGTKQYDVCIIGAGCIGSSIARELSKYKLSVLLLEAADDVSQGATKGNSGIVHAGYDDKPGTNRAKYCWKGNQMFRQLDRELRFGYQVNGSLVLAKDENEMQVLDDLMKRGETNGVERLRILNKEELFEMEPAVHPNCVGALYSPDAGNVIPYEYAIALAENAVDNGVELRIRREVKAISIKDKDNDQSESGNGNGNGNGMYKVHIRHWEPKPYADMMQKEKQGMNFKNNLFAVISITTLIMITMGVYMMNDPSLPAETRQQASYVTAFLSLIAGTYSYAKTTTFFSNKGKSNASKDIKELTDKASAPQGNGGTKVEVQDMFTGGSGSWKAVKGVTVEEETIEAAYVINCAGGASDKVAAMIGDDSFTIKPRLGDYILLNRNQGHLTQKTLFPCPDPVLGKGVLVQTTLWGNLILGPTARDTYKPDALNMSVAEIQEYILSKCKHLVPYFDAKESFHGFCGARAKSSRGDWIIEPSSQKGHEKFIHVAGIDSPGLAGSPAIAVEVVNLLKNAGLDMIKDPSFNPNRAPIITPKVGLKGLKMGPVGKNDSKMGDLSTEEKIMASNVICKCEKVTELEVVRAMRRSLPIDSTQAIRKRTRAGMGHCQGDPDNYNCECRVKAIIARENGGDVDETGGRPWPATTTLPQRWLNDDQKMELQKRMMAQ